MDQNFSTKIETYPLGLVWLDGWGKERAEMVERHIQQKRETSEKFILNFDTVTPRFADGGSKGLIGCPVRGKDIWVLMDPANHSCEYKMYGCMNRKDPDAHHMDARRVLSALSGSGPAQLNIASPFLYGSRQHERHQRESLDCAMALQDYKNAGAKNIIVSDVHNTGVQNAIPDVGFHNLMSTDTLLEAFINERRAQGLSIENLMVISPDDGAMERSAKYASALKKPLGMFYKKRNTSIIKDGKCPVIGLEYIGPSVENMDTLTTDDMIASGGSCIEVAERLKKFGSRSNNIMTTFGLFSNGGPSFEDFKKAYDKGVIDKVYITNLSYVSREAREEHGNWLRIVDSTKQIALVIEALNQKQSITSLMNGTKKFVDAERQSRLVVPERDN